MAEFDPERVETESELSEEEIARVLQRKPKWMVPALISLGSIGLIVLLVNFGGSLLPKGEAPKPMLTPPESKIPTAEFLETISDTLDSTDLIRDIEPESADSLKHYIRQLLATPVDTTQVADLPRQYYDDEMNLIAARVDDADLVGDTTLPFLEMLISPVQNFKMETPLMPWEMEAQRTAALNQQKAAEAAAMTAPPVSAKEQKALEVKQAQIDSLALQLSAAERALAKTSEERTELADRIDRLKPALDSTRAVELKRFSKMLETMKPAAAAQLLANRSSDEVSEILFKVKPKTAAAILQNLPPQLASDIAARVVRR